MKNEKTNCTGRRFFVVLRSLTGTSEHFLGCEVKDRKFSPNSASVFGHKTPVRMTVAILVALFGSAPLWAETQRLNISGSLKETVDNFRLG